MKSGIYFILNSFRTTELRVYCLLEWNLFSCADIEIIYSYRQKFILKIPVKISNPLICYPFQIIKTFRKIKSDLLKCKEKERSMDHHQGFYHQFKRVNIYLSHYLPEGLILFYPYPIQRVFLKI